MILLSWFNAWCEFFFQIIANMKVLMAEDANNPMSNSFLLDDDSRLVWFLKLCLKTAVCRKQVTLSNPFLDLQHSIFCWWHIKIHTRVRSIWCGSSCRSSRKSRFLLLATQSNMMNSLLQELDQSNTAIDTYCIVCCKMVVK